jgi:hypothetical protein
VVAADRQEAEQKKDKMEQNVHFRAGGAATSLCRLRFGKLIADETEKWGKVIRAAAPLPTVQRGMSTTDKQTYGSWGPHPGHHYNRYPDHM